MKYGVCDDFAMIDEDVVVDEYVEDNRYEYRSAYYRYMAEVAEDFFI